MGEVNSFLFNG